LASRKNRIAPDDTHELAEYAPLFLKARPLPRLKPSVERTSVYPKAIWRSAAKGVRPSPAS